MRILLLSGGLDSTVCLYLDKPDLCLTVEYGQPHFAEVRKAKALASGQGVAWQRVEWTWPVALTCGADSPNWNRLLALDPADAPR